MDKSIEHGKEHRRPYRGAKAVDCTCRNHGSCPRCRDGRLHKHLRNLPADDLEDIESLMGFKVRYRRHKDHEQR